MGVFIKIFFYCCLILFQFIPGCDFSYFDESFNDIINGDSMEEGEVVVDDLMEVENDKTKSENLKFPAGEELEKRGEHNAIVVRFYVPVYEKPSISKRIIGSLRKGSIVRVMTAHFNEESCAGGWVWLPDGNGYVCLSHGLKILKDDKVEKKSGQPPWFDSILPYEYGRIGKDDLPAFNRLPTEEERKQVQAWLAERRALLRAQMEAVKKAMEEGTALPNPYEPIELKVEGEKEESSVVVTEKEWTTDVQEGPVPLDIPYKFVEKILLHGFYISIAERRWNNGKRWVKTVRGLLVPGESISVKYPPATRGIELNDGMDLPVIFVKKSFIPVYSIDSDGKKLFISSGKKLSRFYCAPVFEKYEYAGKEFLRISPDEFVNRKDVTVVEKVKPPSIVKLPNQKWIDIDIGKQVIVGYEGTKAVYAALISSGREKENEEFKTPRGLFSILSKHVTGNMTNLFASDGPYMIEDVPWTMYFLGSYALHGAFWHNGFGSMRSHGCVNLAPFDARWFFYWTEPELPEGWHSVYANSEKPATIVKIHD